jgi:HTH-type transcriptional regulator, competence development regulator
VVHIGDKLRSIRSRKLMSQRDLAKRAGLSHNTIVQLESNRTEPHYRTLRKLVEALDVEPDELLGEDR